MANFAEERLARSGLSVAIVSAELYGGDCHYFACVPSKALLRPLEALTASKSIGGTVTNAQLDISAIFKRRDKIVSEWNDNEVISAQSDAWGTTLVRGFGRINGAKKVTVQPHGEEERYELTAKHAVIVSTGSTHILPPIPGIENLEEGKELWNNRDATASNVVPKQLIILGAGAVSFLFDLIPLEPYAAFANGTCDIRSAPRWQPSIPVSVLKLPWSHPQRPSSRELSQKHQSSYSRA